MENIALSLLTGLISAAITAVVTYLATRSKIRLDLTVEYDKELRATRLEVYKKLWKELKPLARFSPEEPLTYSIVKDTSEKMRDWYFDTGGIYLSKESREPYFNLKASLQEIIDDETLQKNKDAPLKDDSRLEKILGQILEQGKALRASLSDDIGTRRQPFL